ncbi:MAG: SOS response-associated peptidase family protein [Bacteriovoracaceae bacterium]|nr:SOS response-associated peptidase family protein [Bacteriovoracaceae bacterium]
MCFSVEVDRDLKKLSTRFNAGIDAARYENFEKLRNLSDNLEIKTALGLKRKPQSNPFKDADKLNRIYPGYFANVMTIENGSRVFKPMRYRIRPEGSKEEIPSKYNVFNARIDSLESRKTWQNLFMKKHGIFPFVRFFEWVEPEGKKKLISFKPDSHEIMWAPCLYDEWKNGEIHFHSFAILTDNPPLEISEQGHDRCPIFLKENLINKWLTPEQSSKSEIYDLLKVIEATYYRFKESA